MKTFILLISLTLLQLLIVLDTLQGGRRTDDHLVPFRPSAYDQLRPSLYKKLLLTPADCGRMIEFPGGPQPGESAVSIHCDKRPVADEQCYVTLTKASSNLSYMMEENLGKRPLEGIERVRVERRDTVIAKSTALAIRATWTRALGSIKPRRSDAPIVLDSERIEFWIERPNATPLFGEIPDNPGKSVVALVQLGRMLAKYCEAPETLRASMAENIERDAKRLATGAQ